MSDGRPAVSLGRDVVSGTIMAATSVPQLIAYAETVGYAGYRGLTTAGVPLAAFGLVTGSPYLNAGVTAVTSLMTKADLDGDAYIASYGQDAYVQAVAAYSFYVGIASILLAITGFGQLAQNVPPPVAAGFKWGCSYQVLFAALPNGLFGRGGAQLKQLVRGIHTTQSGSSAPPFVSYIVDNDWLRANFPGFITLSQIAYAVTHPWTWGLQPSLMFLLGVAFVMNAKQILPSGGKVPPGTEVILVTALATIFSQMTNYQAGVVGTIPTASSTGATDSGSSSGHHLVLPLVNVPIPIEWFDMGNLIMNEGPTMVARCFNASYIRLALSVAIFSGVNFLSICAVAGIFESENNIPWSAPRELLAQGVANVAAAAVGSAPVSGSLSRSLVSRMTGTTSSAACLVTAACWIGLQPYMSIMSQTPKAALSSVIVAAVLRGVMIPKDLLKLAPHVQNQIVGWGTGIITLLTNPTKGFGFGLVFHYLMMYVIAPVFAMIGSKEGTGKAKVA